MKTYPDVPAWYDDLEHWRDEVAALLDLVRSTGLEETLKWGQPAYTLGGKNICIVSWRKDGAVLSLLKGGLVEDPTGRLVFPGDNARRAKYALFSSVAQIEAERELILALLASAVEVERSGKRFPPQGAIEYCEELQDRLDGDPVFAQAFEGLTEGRRRHYNMHFAGAKQAATREKRIDAATERILMGKGLRDCVCGRSKRMPGCDGSHKEPA